MCCCHFEIFGASFFFDLADAAGFLADDGFGAGAAATVPAMLRATAAADTVMNARFNNNPFPGWNVYLENVLPGGVVRLLQIRELHFGLRGVRRSSVTSIEPVHRAQGDLTAVLRLNVRVELRELKDVFSQTRI